MAQTGSHMWGMNVPDSDRDMTVVYLCRTEDILSGRVCDKTKPQRTYSMGDDLHDIQYMEAGHFVNLLAKANINTVIALMAPMPLYVDEGFAPRHRWLQDIFGNRPTTAICPSLEGMVMGYIMNAGGKRAAVVSLEDLQEGAPIRIPDDPNAAKKLQGAARLLQFGAEYLRTGAIQFDSVPFDIVEMEHLDCYMDAYDAAKAACTHADAPNVEEMRNWLLDARLSVMPYGPCTCQ